METLPPEMVDKIARHLTPQDLARCCGVCKNWRDIFNEDHFWKPHCDVKVEEHLHTTPCAVEPAFVTPGASESTLSPISRWRLALLREKHLWKNWKRGNYRTERVLQLENEVRRDFLTNTLLVIWCRDKVEIWNVSVIPATFVIRSFDLRHYWLYCRVVGSSMLLVDQMDSVKIFHVDAVNKCIELKYDIPIGETRYLPELGLNIEDLDLAIEYLNFVKGNTYVRVNANQLTFEIIDLETGNRIKKESCPVKGYGNEVATIREIKSSPTSDCMIVLVHVPQSSDFHFYIYSLQQLTFLPRAVCNCDAMLLDHAALHDNYLAVCVGPSLQIYDCRTSELIFTKLLNGEGYPQVFNDSFILSNRGTEGELGWFGMFTPTNKTFTTITRHSLINERSLEIVNNKFVKVTDSYNENVIIDGIWEASGQTLKRSDISIIRGAQINQAFTVGIGFTQDYSYSYFHYW